VGTFRIGLHSLHSLHCFLLLRERGSINNTISSQIHQLVRPPAKSKPSTWQIAYPNLGSGLYTIPPWWPVAHALAFRRPNRRPKYACCRSWIQTIALFCGVNALGHLLLAEPSPPRCATKTNNAL
jgi:hypothetical protein